MAHTYYLSDFELVDELGRVIIHLEGLTSQLEKLRSIWFLPSLDSLAYSDVNEHLRAQIGQLAKIAAVLRDTAKKRINALSPKASLLKHRLEYLEARRAIGMVSEEVYAKARQELMGRVVDVEDYMMRLIELLDQLDNTMLKLEPLLNAASMSSIQARSKSEVTRSNLTAEMQL